VAATAVGVAVLALLVWYAGAGSVLRRLAALGWGAPLVLVPYLLINALDTLGWRCTLPSPHVHRVPFLSLYLVRMAGEAVNSVTPTAAVGGEPVKAQLLRAYGIAGSDAAASVVIAKTALVVSQAAFVLIGLAALFERLERRTAGAIWVTVLILVCALFAVVLVGLQRRGPVSAVWRGLRWLAPRSPRIAGLESAARAVDARLADYYRIERRGFVLATLWHLAAWLLGVGEVVLIMELLDTPITLLDALIIEALAQPIRAVAVIVPGGLGLQEVGGVALASSLGVPEAAGVALWLLKRAREIVFDVVGLAFLTRRAVGGAAVTQSS
jgi:putative membrane protein